MAILRGVVLLLCLWLSRGVVVPVKYLGCFQDAKVPGNSTKSDQRGGFLRKANVDRASVNSCVYECFALRWKMAALQGGTDCYCGQHSRGLLSLRDEYCFYPCKGNCRQRCGGLITMSVYQTGYQREPDMGFEDWIIRESFLKCYRYNQVFKYCQSRKIKPDLTSPRMTVQLCALYCGSGRRYEQLPVALLMSTESCCCSKLRWEAHEGKWGNVVWEHRCNKPCRGSRQGSREFDKTQCAGNTTEKNIGRTVSTWDVILMKDRGMPTEPRSIFENKGGWVAPVFRDKFELKDGIYQYELDARKEENTRRKRNVNINKLSPNTVTSDDDPGKDDETNSTTARREETTDSCYAMRTQSLSITFTQNPDSQSNGDNPKNQHRLPQKNGDTKLKTSNLTRGRSVKGRVLKTASTPTVLDSVTSGNVRQTSRRRHVIKPVPVPGRNAIRALPKNQEQVLRMTTMTMMPTVLSAGSPNSGDLSLVVHTAPSGIPTTAADPSIMDRDTSAHMYGISSWTPKNESIHRESSKTLEVWAKLLGSSPAPKQKNSDSGHPKIVVVPNNHRHHRRQLPATGSEERVLKTDKGYHKKRGPGTTPSIEDSAVIMGGSGDSDLKKVRRKRRVVRVRLNENNKRRTAQRAADEGTVNKTEKKGTKLGKGGRWREEALEDMPELSGQTEAVAKIKQPVIDPENTGVKVMDVPEEEDETTSIEVVLLGFFVCLLMLFAVAVILFRRKHPVIMSAMTSLRALRDRRKPVEVVAEPAAVVETTDTTSTEADTTDTTYTTDGISTAPSTTDDETQPLIV